MIDLDEFQYSTEVSSNASDDDGELREMTDYPDEEGEEVIVDENTNHSDFFGHDEDSLLFTPLEFWFTTSGNTIMSISNNVVPNPTAPTAKAKRPRELTFSNCLSEESAKRHCCGAANKIVNVPICTVSKSKIEDGGEFVLKSFGCCSICQEDSNNATVFNCQTNTVATIGELGTSYQVEDRYIFSGPCGENEHLVCVGCLKQVLISKTANPIHENQANVPCLYPFGEKCGGKYDIQDFEAILEDVDFKELKARWEKYKHQGMQTITCTCGCENQICREQVKNTPRGKLLVLCKEFECSNLFCYHCLRDVDFQCEECQYCSLEINRNDPFAWNFYYAKPAHFEEDSHCQNDLFSHLLRNNQISDSICKEQIHNIMIMETLTPQCSKCATPMFKTTECNGMTHCNIQKCYTCGKNTMETGYLAEQHWDVEGLHGCARFDNDTFWNGVANCEFRCRDGECHNDHRDCNELQHKNGINNMNFHRKCWHIFYLIHSLLPEMRKNIYDHVIQKYWKSHGNIIYFLQENRDLVL